MNELGWPKMDIILIYGVTGWIVTFIYILVTWEDNHFVEGGFLHKLASWQSRSFRVHRANTVRVELISNISRQHFPIC